MATDKIRKYVLPNIPYLFIGWFCLKIGTAYRLAAGAGFGEKLLGLGQTIGAAFAMFHYYWGLCYWTNCIYCATLVLAQNYVNVLLNTRRPQRHNKQEI